LVAKPLCYQHGGFFVYFIDLPLKSATLNRSSLMVAFRPAGSLSRDYHLLADVFYVIAPYGFGSGIRRALIPPHNQPCSAGLCQIIHGIIHHTRKIYIFLFHTFHLTKYVCFGILAAMSIKLTLTMGSLKTEASIKDSAYNELMQLVFKHQDGVMGALAPEKLQDGGKGVPAPKEGETNPAQQWILKHTASEVLNRIGWKTNPEKILLLGAFHETHGGSEGWRNADINERFNQAKEPVPRNFPRDIRTAIEDGMIGTVTSRTYKVGRAGWNKIAEAIKTLP
jgi:hypothetical protein